MNERIRQLADKIWEEKYWTNPNTDRLLPAQLNRFAELIVRECADQLPRISEEYYTGDGIVEDAQKLILEHFGVES